MYKKAWCMCKVVVLRNKPIAFLTSSLPSPSSLLKLPIFSAAEPSREASCKAARENQTDFKLPCTHSSRGSAAKTALRR